MTRDKQLSSVCLQAVRSKQKLDQALNVKEFAVLAGISYSVAREWFQLPGFPAICGKVFWQDFVIWRRTLRSPKPLPTAGPLLLESHSETAPQWPARAVRILSESK